MTRIAEEHPAPPRRLRSALDLWLDSTLNGRQAGLGKLEINLRQRLNRREQGISVSGDKAAQRAHDPLDLPGLGKLQLTPPIPQLDCLERLDVDSLPAC